MREEPHFRCGDPSSPLLAAAEAAGAAVAQQSQEPKGRLKITATPEFRTTRVDNWVAAYLSKWPKVTVEAVYPIRFVDIIHEGINVAIRIGALQDSDLSARKLGEITYGLCASPDYLKRVAPHRTVEDLKRHDLIMKTSSGRAARHSIFWSTMPANSGWGGLADSTPEAWDTMFAVHARAPFFLVQSALSRLSDGGRIINLSSGASTRPMSVVPIYSMAKANINNLKSRKKLGF